MKTNEFDHELSLIANEEIRQFTTELLEKLPDYFYNVPASSTGKHHPSYALGEGGLVRHTKAAVRIAQSLFELEMFNPLSEVKDHILSALLLHEGLKHGHEFSRYTLAQHPCIMSAFIKENATNADHELIARLVLTHMGQWNRDYKNKVEIMPKPENRPENFVHLCDYLASRKMLEFNFDVTD